MQLGKNSHIFRLSLTLPSSSSVSACGTSSVCSCGACKNKKILSKLIAATCHFSFVTGRSSRVEISLRQVSAQMEFVWSGKSHGERYMRFCRGSSRRFGRTNIRYMRPKLKISVHHQVSRYIRPCSVLGTSPISLLLSDFGSRSRCQVNILLLVRNGWVTPTRPARVLQRALPTSFRFPGPRTLLLCDRPKTNPNG